MAAITKLENGGRFEVHHVGRDQQISLTSNDNLQHMPVSLIAQGLYAAADNRMWVIASRPERGYATDGADQGLGCVASTWNSRVRTSARRSSMPSETTS